MKAILAAILIASPVLAADVPDSSASAPQFQPKAVGKFMLSNPVCKNGVMGVHITASEAAEGNVYFNLKAICGHGDDDAPAEPQSGKPLPEGTTRL